MTTDDLLARLDEADEDYTRYWGNGDLYGEAAAALRAKEEELAEARQREADFHMAYRMKCDEQTKAALIRAESLAALLRELFNNMPDSKIEEYRERGEERIPVLISIDYLDRTRAALSDAPRSEP